MDLKEGFFFWFYRQLFLGLSLILVFVLWHLKRFEISFLPVKLNFG